MRLGYDPRRAQISRRAEFLVQLGGELLAILLGLWMVFGLGWEEFGPSLVLFGLVGFVVTAHVDGTRPACFIRGRLSSQR